MAQPKTRRHRRGSWKSDSSRFEFPDAVRAVLDEDDPALFTAVTTGLARARFAGEDITDNTVAEWVVAAARAEVAERRTHDDWAELITAT